MPHQKSPTHTMYREKMLEQKLKSEFKVRISANIPNFLSMPYLHVFAFFQLKPTNIFKEMEVSEEGTPEGPASAARRRKITSPKGTSQKKVDFLIS